MRSVRAYIKIFLLISFTLVSYAVYLSVYLILRLLRQPFESWRNLYMRTWSKVTARIFNIKFHVHGTPPEPPFILVSNHLSYIDILPMFINMKCTFVAKKEVESWPVLGYMVKKTGVIFVDRTVKRDVTRVNELLEKSLNKYQGIVLFPEGTTTGGDKVLPFRSSLLNYPASESIPVYYSAVQYRTSKNDPPADESVCFYGARDPFHKHVFKLAGNKRIECRLVYSKDSVVTKDRKELADQLHDKVEQQVLSLRTEMA
ncbi:lysophospholipid acyltransferase family protein [Rhodohalobacter sp. 614A]|uniref:lysophospholipid acyltransferase family protein n=1 Tax=Rhodohalobacter sp. 614A TaxID=2908649 RepID=UPI001F34C306|nr:lysophospholipid acyltransferase family protein [Rhodohalobacter sp. 614A]